jgi:hypothetical protein
MACSGYSKNVAGTVGWAMGERALASDWYSTVIELFMKYTYSIINREKSKLLSRPRVML